MLYSINAGHFLLVATSMFLRTLLWWVAFIHRLITLITVRSPILVMPWPWFWRIAGNDIESHRFEANNCFGIRHYPDGDARNTVAVLRIVSRLHVLSPIEQHLPSLFLPLAPSKHHVDANGLRRDCHHDHRDVFPSGLLQFSMWSTMAVHLPWWDHGSRLVHHCDTAITSHVDQQIPTLQSVTLRFYGALRHRPWNSRRDCQLVKSAAQHRPRLRVRHIYILHNRGRVLC